MSKIVRICFVAVLMANNFAAAADRVKVAITEIIAYPITEIIRKGVEDALLEGGYKDGENLELTFLSAQGNISTATQIARKFAGDNPDVIVAISTPSAQTVAAATKTIPIVFSAVSDPVEAKLVSSLVKPGGNVTGTTERVNLAENLRLLREVKPDLKRLGFIYNASEANSVSILKALKNIAREVDIEIVPSSAPRPSDVQAATRALIGKVDIIFVPSDNTILSVIDGVSSIALETNTPLFAIDSEMIGRGPFITQGVSFYNIGVDTGKIVLRILKGEKPGDIDIVHPDNKNIAVDLTVSEKNGIVIPPSVLGRAVKIVQ